MTAISDDTGVPKRASFSDRISAGRSGLLGRLRAEGWDIRNTWQVVAGAILVPVGFAIIVLGWYGAAHGRVDQQQIPYLISGGILGLAAVILGGFFFWAHWLYRIYDQAELHHQAALREQAEFNRALVSALAQRGFEPSVAPKATAATRSTASEAAEFVATPTGTNFHSLSCPIVANKTDQLRQLTRAEAKSMKPCRICEPKL